VGRCKKCHLLDALDQIRSMSIIPRRAICGAKQLLDDEASEAVSNEDQWSTCERGFGQEPGENVRRLVGQVHCPPAPARDRGVVADHVNRKHFAIARQPERPERIVLVPWLAAGIAPPCTVVMAAKAMDEQHTGKRLTGWTANLEKL
jgi:hypothetical protein